MQSGQISILKRHTLQNPNFTNAITVPYSTRMHTITHWDDVCIYAIERFGLPGDKYITDISADSMTWLFKSEKDALMFKLRWSEVVC